MVYQGKKVSEEPNRDKICGTSVYRSQAALFCHRGTREVCPVENDRFSLAVLLVS